MPLSTERTKVEALGALVNSSNIPEGSSVGKVIPMTAVDNTAGDVYFMPAIDRSAATGMDTTVGAAREAEMVTSAHANYTLGSRKSKRIGVGFDEEVSLGNDLEAVKELGGTRCALRVWKELEKDHWDLYKKCALGDEAPIVPGTLKPGTVRKQLLDAARDVTPCGKPVFVMTHSTLVDLTNIPEIREHLVIVSKVTGNDGMVRNVAVPVAHALADSLAITEVIEVADYLAPAEAKGCIYVFGRQEGTVGSDGLLRVAKSLPLVATFVYNKPAAEAANEAPLVSMYCYADNKDEINYFDAQGKWAPLVLNGKAGCKLLTLATNLADYNPGAPAAASVMTTAAAAPAAAPVPETTAAEAAEKKSK